MSSRSPEQPVVKILRSTQGAQLLELALALPVLLVMVIAITDFGRGYNLRQELNNAAREGARFAIEESCADCSTSAPRSTQAIENDVVQYLKNAGVDVCGFTGTETPSAGTAGYASFVYTSPNACFTSGGTNFKFTIEIDRAITFTNSSGVVSSASKIILSYPYQWSFGNIIGFIVPGATYTTTTINTDATMQNLVGF